MEAICFKNKKDIEAKLINIFKSRYKINFQDEYKEFLDEHLLGLKFKFKPRDLLYLFDDVETQFKIKIPQEDINQGRFSSFNNIISIIDSQINKGI